jgi:sporulation protein YlmC with PRC-barrel domain
MITGEQLDTTRGAPVVSKDGKALGNVEAIYLDADSGEPEWAVVNTGRFGHRSSFVPLKDATFEAGTLTVPYDENVVTRSPAIEPGERISESQEAELYAAYGLPHRRGMHVVPYYDIFPNHKLWT